MLIEISKYTDDKNKDFLSDLTKIWFKDNCDSVIKR